MPEFDCVVDPNMTVELSSAVDGVVESMQVQKGDHVKKGQVVARLDAGPQVAAVEYARTRAAMNADLHLQEESLAYGRRSQKRITALHVKHAISDDEVDKAETETRLTRIKLEQAREKKRLARLDLRRATATLAQYTIHSPIDGVVTERYLNPGESTKDHPLLKLAQTDPLRVEIIVPVVHFGALKPGQQVDITPEAPMNGRHRGTVTIIDPVVDAASGTFRVRVILPNADHKLTSGLKCKARFLDEYAPLAPASQEQKASPATTPPTPEPPEEKADVPPVVGAPPKAAQCMTLGPFTSSRTARRLTAALTAHQAQVRQRHEKADPHKASRYLLLTDRMENAAAARRLAQEIRAKSGIRDVAPITRGSMKNRVSLGVHTRRSFAQERLEKIRKAGFDAVLMPQYNGRPRIWLNIQLSGGKDLDAIKPELKAIAPGLHFRKHACGAPALAASR